MRDKHVWKCRDLHKEILLLANINPSTEILNPFSTGTGWNLYKVYGGFRISEWVKNATAWIVDTHLK